MTLKTFAFCALLICSANCLKAQSAVAVGNQAPDINFQYAIGASPKPGFYKGKILVIDFWATWCAPCIGGFPEYNQLADSYKANKDIVFAAMTREPKATVDRFFARTQKQLDALKLIDTTGQTEHSLNIHAIPCCIIIDKNNVIRWMGSSRNLNKDIIDAVIAGKEIAAAGTTGKPEPAPEMNKPINQRALFTFSVAKSNPGKKSIETFGATGMNNHIVSFSESNIPLNVFIGELSGLGGNTRVISDSTERLNQLIDIYLKIGDDTTIYSNYYGRVLKGAADKNYILSFLELSLKFKTQPIKQKITHYELVVQDAAKLNGFKSAQHTHSSYAPDKDQQLEIVGYPLSDIAVKLEAFSQIIITTQIKDTDWYDLSLDAADKATLDKSLQLYGLKLKEVTDEVDFLKLTFDYPPEG